MALAHSRTMPGKANGSLATSRCYKAPTLTRARTARQPIRASSAVEPGATVLVAGGTGGVGQLTTAKLLERGFNVRLLARNRDKARQLFGSPSNLEVVLGDTRSPAPLAEAAQGVQAVCCCTGTTAFPSSRWKGDNGPRRTDFEGVVNLIDALPKDIRRFVFVTSVGVERQDQLPWCILNLFGVLQYKRQSELHLINSGLPYTILRPNRLTDGPYTSYDLNTLLKATSGSRQQVELAKGDCLGRGEASRIAVAEAVVQALGSPVAENQIYCMGSSEGEGPGADPAKWDALFTAAA